MPFVITSYSIHYTKLYDSDIEIKYNEKGDVIYSKDHLSTTSTDATFLPTNGFAYRSESIFRYEYFQDKKIRYA